MKQKKINQHLRMKQTIEKAICNIALMYCTLHIASNGLAATL